ncbi:4-oxalocrotonate tautomerase family protein [Oscillatoria sp. CS-180]|uniref:tautomerase family protein n=1 Tax=Oscillatoria sp. CS-180 TaxID=3021720 RepID=UPI00232F16CC|nr:4-oxalocrotonate tautomerase family protein [Oscillatoria sp. CS-180]MDB9527731.1 4-oxalocrotonate tautomerase family protein [Oscillatoria sp. CS-180]
MPIVTIQQSSGRTLDQKRLLVKRVTEAFQEAYGLGPEAVTIFLQDFEDDGWGKEGLLHCDRRTSANPSSEA